MTSMVLKLSGILCEDSVNEIQGLYSKDKHVHEERKNRDETLDGAALDSLRLMLMPIKSSSSLHQLHCAPRMLLGSTTDADQSAT
eukprot:746530-Pelagomonas_calceolata.AAC.1